MEDANALHAARVMKALTGELVRLFENGAPPIPAGQVRQWSVPVVVETGGPPPASDGVALTGAGHLLLLHSSGTTATALSAAECISLGLALIAIASERMAAEQLAQSDPAGTA